MRRVLVIACALSILAAGCAATPVTILYTNDLHLRFGRLDSIARLIEAERAGGSPVFLFDGGDAWQDFRRPLAAVWGADEMVAWMNDVGYDAMALGNHDSYWGPARLGELTGEANFPVLCANLQPIRGVPPFSPSARLEKDGISVLAIGLITDEWFPYSAYATLRPVPAATVVHDAIDRAAAPVDLVVVVAHLPVAEAARIAEAVPEIDVFVTGHSHQETGEPVRVGETLIVQSGQFGENLGRLVIDVDPAPGEHRLIGNDLIAAEKAPTDIGRGLRRLLLVTAATVAATLLIVL